MNLREKIAKLGEVLPSTILEQHLCEALQKQRERRQRTMSPLIARRRKVIAMMHGNINLVKNFGMERMTTEIDG